MTRPQDVSAAPVSEPAHHASTADLDDTLICPAAEIFDRGAIMDAITASRGSARDAKALRAVIVDALKTAIAAGRARIDAAVEQRPKDARAAARSYCYLTDQVVLTVFDYARTVLYPNANPSEGERIALLAVGGYGRGEMAPFSDVDLLFLSPYKIAGWTESIIESMLYIFWDLHLKVGHASRTIKECVKLAREDITIRTALLENRHLAGEEPLSRKLDNELWSKVFQSTAGEFAEAKLAERDARHSRQGGQRYVVEPNVKEGKGGLRDLQTLFWIAKYTNRVENVAALVARGVFSKDELAAFLSAEEFLFAVRTQLHLIAGRAMDQLTFDMQPQVAERLGYTDRGGRPAVEVFMQDYFRHATKVGELTRILLTSLEAQLVRAAPTLVGRLRRKAANKAPEGYIIVHNRLNVADKSRFLDDKLNILRVFEVALRHRILLHPDVMRLIAANLNLIDDELRASPEANRIFLDLLLKHGNPERALRRMNELGVLGAFIPDFAPVVAMMQFNMYHAYTVDEHTIQCISILAQIERGELTESLPLTSRILKNGVNRRVLYLALLLHDIGKGRDEDHSIVGARIARRLAPRFGLRRAEVDTVEWLVRNHLLMSDVAQKRDIAEPRTIKDFAKAVKTKERLDLLTTLTACDIRGVGPGVWNNWKAQLLRALYRETWTALESGLEAINRENREAEGKKALREALSDWDAKDLRTEVGRHYGPYWQLLPTGTHVVFANLLRGISDDEIRIDLHPDDDRDATRVCFALADHPGIFARLTGALALVGANIVDARTYTTKDGYATPVFWVQDNENHPFDPSRLPRLRSMIEKTLHGEIKAREALEPRDKMKKREKAFDVPTSITFDNEGSDINTIIEVDTRDRPGLLFDLARTLSAAHVHISSAVIATYGEQAVDSFYVKDSFGLKLHSASRQRNLEARLREAIVAGSVRARS